MKTTDHKIERKLRSVARLHLLICVLYGLNVPADATVQEWSYYGATQSGTRYSSLDQIKRNNVRDLEVAWIYRTGELNRFTPTQIKQQSFENTPILLDGSLLVCTPTGRVMALNPGSGEELWVFDPNHYPLPADLHYPKCRGVSHWLDPEAADGSPCRRRIIYGTWEFKVYAIDSKTGRPCPDFGDNGMLEFSTDKALVPREFIYFPSPPAVVDDVILFGSMIFDNLRTDAPSGKVRAIDARSGELRWEFDPIPRDPADPAQATWLGNSAQATGHGNVWSMMSVDEERGLVFLPTTSPSTDFYGGRRPGENRYTDSLVALRGKSGEMVWHYQITHHDVWDYDLPAQPILADIPRDGEEIPAVIQLTKQGLDPADAWGFTFIDRHFCRKKIAALRHDGMYTPPSLQGTVLMPSFAGGANWGGGAYDPVRNLLIVNTIHMAAVARLVPRTDLESEVAPPQEVDISNVIRFPQLGTPYAVENWFITSPLGAPCTQPPWGRLTAVDLVNGTIRWQVALGSLEKLLPLPIPLEMGTPSAGGAIVTAGGVVFIAATVDDNFRAFDVDTGKVLWKTKLPAGGQATPMTYSVGGRQYVVVAAGGHALYQSTPGDYIIAYALK